MMEINAEIKTLEANLAALSLNLVNKIEWLEAQSNTREACYKEIVLKEMKKSVKRLSEIDEQVSEELKSDAESILGEMSNIEEEISNAIATLSITEEQSKKGVIEETIMKLQTKVAALEKSFPTTALELSVAESSGHLLELTGILIDSILIGSSKTHCSDKVNCDQVLTSHHGSKSTPKNSKLCYSPERNSLEGSMWEIDTPLLQKGQFLSTWMVDRVSRPTDDPLVTPHDVTFLKHHCGEGFYLVTYPLNNRVIIYSYAEMDYLGELGNGALKFSSPTNILSLSHGGLVVLEENKMDIFDGHCELLQEIHGKYRGLTEGQDGEILTLQGQKVLKFNKTDGIYAHIETIKLHTLEGFEKWYTLTKPRNLLYSKDSGSLHITDSGLHKVVTIDPQTHKQTAVGYLGEGIGQLKNPAAMIADDVGNLLVLDEGNGRIVVCSSSGAWVKVMIENVPKATGLSLSGNEVVVIFSTGCLVRYRFDRKN